MLKILRFLFITGLFASCAVHALTFNVLGTGSKQISIAILPFTQESAYAQAITPVIRADLERTGQFNVVETNLESTTGQHLNQIPYEALARLKIQAVAIGSVEPQQGQLAVRYRLVDVAQRTFLSRLVISDTQTRLRPIAHAIADDMYEKLTGIRGVFSTRIAYVLQQKKRYSLVVADADGFNPVSVFSNKEPIISPAWSPDGSRLAYVSFETLKPVVYVQTLATGERRAVAKFKGSNSAPAWSSDGKRLAVALTHQGQSQIYEISAQGGEASKRLTVSQGIDTEPDYSPDGTVLYFTSDRGGSPQIYRMSAAGGGATRVTFDGNYNVSPRISPDGKQMVFVQRVGGRFRLTLYDFNTQQTRLMSDTGEVESPTFSPNGQFVLYAVDKPGGGTLSAISVDGRVRHALAESSGIIREPAWGPFRN